MEPQMAVSLASAVIQLVDFSRKVAQKDKVGKVYKSTGTTLREATLLDDAIANLGDLSQQLEKARRIYYKSHISPDQEVADAQLMALAKDGGGVAKILQATLDQAKRNHDVDEQTVLAQGLRSVLSLYYSQKTICDLADRLDSIRKQVDVALLAALRQHATRQHSVHSEKRRLPVDGNTGPDVLLLQSIAHHDWKTMETVDVSAFSDTFENSVVSNDMEGRFASLMLARLHFIGMHDRYKAIPIAHPGTSRWILDASPEQPNTDDFDSFPRWLAATGSSNAYWISGKPGTGKSTLTKFLSSHRCTTAHLRAWAKGRKLVKGSFFLSSLGNHMQKSRMGLLQALLHSALKGDMEILIQVFRHRWQQFLASGGGRQPFTWLELRQAFITMISTPSTPTSFFFAIDGLDELEGGLKDILQLIKDIAKYPNVKVCVASRSSPELLRALAGHPNLRPERWNRQDICNYVTASLARSQVYVKLSKTDPTRATELVKGIAKKAAGIFLWAYIVSQLLLDDMSPTSRIGSLIARLETMPSGLEQLFTKLLGRLDKKLLKHASQLLRLMTIKPRPLLLELWFADGNNDDAALRNEARPLSDNEIYERLEMMNPSHVTWTHRIAKDFVRSQRIWNIMLDNTGHDAFDPEWHWANGQLGLFKTVAGTTSTKTSHFIFCVDYALRLEQRLNICPVKFLDEVGRTTTIYATVYDDIVPRKLRGTVNSFLEFAVLFNLVSYVRGRGLTLSKEELLHASRLLGALDAKKWEVFVKRFDHPGIWSTEFEERKKDMQQVMDSLLDRGGGESRWQRARKRLSGQKKI
ncbi:uncharacterized protein J4E84_008845 [Alternaria hordeiaustralica]|uniref:uncharacterized protein n=1 Tax=Alternaria hordeiaustralica TaxID=1187925 RepID=UPI0020C2A343|nr:uncharacterized protein J4E84_008845 [Alternaria hordeiaustralica]KAI4677900.1 hypothetical protein J4E84_008845 [Alternaria hordeiaustralica]